MSKIEDYIKNKFKGLTNAASAIKPRIQPALTNAFQSTFNPFSKEAKQDYNKFQNNPYTQKAGVSIYNQMQKHPALNAYLTGVNESIPNKAFNSLILGDSGRKISDIEVANRYKPIQYAAQASSNAATLGMANPVSSLTSQLGYGAFGGGASKVLGGSFDEGATRGMNMGAVGNLTNPLISKAVGAIGAPATGISRQIIPRVATAAMNIPEGMAMNKAAGYDDYTKTDLAMDVGSGLLFGGPSAAARSAKTTDTGQVSKLISKTETSPIERQAIEEVSKPSVIKTTKNSTRDEVAASLDSKINDLTESVLGYSSKPLEGGTKEASAYTKAVRGGLEKISTGVEKGMSSENKLVRNAATAIQNFFRGAGMSPERAAASRALAGDISLSSDRAFRVAQSLNEIIGGDKASKARINAVLDPKLSKLNISYKDLTPDEKSVYDLVRKGLDLAHDTAYASGELSEAVYKANYGKYTPRLYESYEMPSDIPQSLGTGSKKIVNQIYKRKSDLNIEQKIEDSLNDPIYALGKRLSQVQTNKAIREYTDYLASNPSFVSDVAKPGYTKLADSGAYGKLSGKYVLNSAAEDLKGFFFANDSVQKLYDVFRAYDKFPPRQAYKKLLTVFNPTTNVGNITTDQVFGFMTGVDPLTLNKNLIDLRKDKATYNQISDYLMSKGVTGTDISRTDFTNTLDQMSDLSKGKSGKLKAVTKKVESFYGGTDDAYKIAAFKSLLDKGFTLEEATRKVYDGFQNYASVGKYYDVWSKTPVVGPAFIKFQGDLMRIIKNGAVNNPAGLIGFLVTLKGVADLASRASGESPADKATRENRFGAPVIAGLNIPLTWQTPYGEINVARYISPSYENIGASDMSKSIPFGFEIDRDYKGNIDVGSTVAKNANDPLVAPLVQLAVDRDFRGKPIADPDQTTFSSGNLTPGEKLKNQAVFAARGYTPPVANSLVDVASVASGGKDRYGRTQTVPQALARVGGVKITQYGPEQAQETRAKDAKYALGAKKAIETQVKAIKKEWKLGNITEEVANKRIDYLTSKIPTEKAMATSGVGGGVDYSYISDNNSMYDLGPDVEKALSMPESSNYEKSKKEDAVFSLVSRMADNFEPAQFDQALQSLGVDKADAERYITATEPTDVKYSYVTDGLNNLPELNSNTMMEYLTDLTTPINGKAILSSTVIDDLYNNDIITSAQKKYLKGLKYSTDGKLLKAKSSGSGSSSSSKKVKALELKPYMSKAGSGNLSVKMPKLTAVSYADAIGNLGMPSSSADVSQAELDALRRPDVKPVNIQLKK